MANRMITYDMLRKLREFFDGEHLITSFYLSTVEARGDFVERAQKLIGDARKRLEEADYSEEQKKSVLADFDKISGFVRDKLPIEVKDANPFLIKGVAVFSSSARGFFQVYYMPRPLRERVVFDFSPYIRPLTLLLDEYKRYLVVVVDHKKARFYEMFMGSIVDAEKLVDLNLRARLKSPPPRLRRKYDYAIAGHYMNVAESIDLIMSLRDYDLLIIGEPKKLAGRLMAYLPFRLRQKVAGRFEASPSDSIEAILRRARKIEEIVEREEEMKLVRELKDRLSEGQFAVSGLKDTLDALMHNQVQTLIVEEGYEVSGVRCPKCGFLGTDEAICPVCGSETLHVVDIVDDAIEEAIEQGASVEHVIEKSLLEDVGHIAALLRFEEEGENAQG